MIISANYEALCEDKNHFFAIFQMSAQFPFNLFTNKKISLKYSGKLQFIPLKYVKVVNEMFLK